MHHLPYTFVAAISSKPTTTDSKIVASSNNLASGRQHRLPFHYQYDPPESEDSDTYVLVDKDYSWRNRQTGIILGQWQTGVGFWQHYLPDEVLKMDNNRDRPQPWTSGYMRKHLKQISDDQFDLWSVYETSAQGKFLEGFMKERTTIDHHMEHMYSFRKVPYRITDLKGLGMNLVPGWDSTLRAFIVQPNACTFSGKLWIPTIAEQKEALLLLQQQQQEQQKEKDNTNDKRGTVVAIQTYELWLAEEFEGRKEGRKVGVFLQYNGITGKLQQVFQMHEIALSKDAVDADDDMDPSKPIDFSQYKNLHPTAVASAKVCDNESDSTRTTTVSGRILHLNNGPQGAEHAREFTNQPFLSVDELIRLEEEDSAYLNLQLDNGIQLYIPKAFDASLSGRLLLQMSCPRMDGSLHRITVLGDREQHGFHTLCYEHCK